MKLVRILAVFALASCGGANYYEGDDAALVARPCGVQSLSDPSGKHYRAYISIIEVDGSFTGSGRGCPYEFAYRIKPGPKRLTLIPNLDSPSDGFLLYGRLEVIADLKPRTEYSLAAVHTGGTIGVRISESRSGREVGYGETAKIERSSKANAAEKVVPLMVK